MPQILSLNLLRATVDAVHDQAENNHPRQGVFVFQIPLQACLQKVDEKQKNHAQHGGCFLFAGLKLRDGRAKRGTPASNLEELKPLETWRMIQLSIETNQIIHKYKSNPD